MFFILRYLVRFMGVLAVGVSGAFAARAEINVFPTGARSTALANATVTVADVFAVYNNQAALGFVDETVAAVDYQNRFMTDALHVAALGFAMPVPYAGTVGIGVCSFGAAPYNELRAGVSLGKQLSDYIAVGAQIDYNQITIGNHGRTGAVAAEIGLLARPVEKMWVGAHIYNFTYSRFMSQEYDERLPVIFNVGAGYKATEEVTLLLQGEFRSSQNARLKAGCEYFLFSKFALRAGVMLSPVEAFAGAGYTIRSFTFDFAFAHHQTLGYSPQMSVCYSFDRRR